MVIFVANENMSRPMRLAALLITLLILAQNTFAQQPTRAELEKRRQDIIQSINETEELLEATKKNKNATIGQLRALQNKLSERQKLIKTINDEIGAINSNIQTSTHEVNTLKNNLEVLKARYAQSVRYAYKTRSSYDMLAFLFSSNDFNEALRRIRYLKKYREYRKEQADKIRITQGEIVKKINVLNSERSQKDALLSTEVQQRSVLQKESDETNKVVKDLKSRESQLLKQIEKNKRTARQLDKAVADIIRREIEIARKKAEEEERKRQEEEKRKAALAASNAPGTGKISVTTNNGNMPPPRPNNTSSSPAVASNTPTATTPKPRPAANYDLTPEAAALSSSLENNRGRLPWPVEKGFISETFGRHPHPDAPKVMVEQSGVDIQTSAGAVARAVFDGVVANVFSIDGSTWNVLISHGNYFTVYAKLAGANVKKGQSVKTKQPIGTVATGDDGTSTINFQIWKGGNKMDPSGWIAR